MFTRRKFLKTLGGAITITTSPFLLEGCAAGLATFRGEFDGTKITIPKSEAVALTAPEGVMMVRASNFPISIVVRNLAGQGIIALSTVCTHKGCEVRVMPNSFHCPCHGSAYHADGTVEEGPASRPLQRFAVEEIKLETALVDLLLATPINLRAGILLSPLGRFNLAHDGPRYNVIDRPLVSTQIIPATLSEVGAGFFGAFYLSAFDRFTYEIYAVNGLSDGVVLGSGEGARIPQGKSTEAFAEDNNGSPACTGRLAYNPRFGGEFGISFHAGRYNTYQVEGRAIDDPRSVRLFALDADYRWRRWHFRGEAALAHIDTPSDHVDNDFIAERQRGFYLEGNYTFLRRPLFGMTEAALVWFSRYDSIDLNVGAFDKTGENIGDATRRLTTGIAFRPTADTAIRLSYWRQWDYDQFNNLSHSMNVQFGVATYF